MDDCVNCEFLEKCREWLKNNGFRAFVQEFYDENGRFYAVVEY